MTIPEHADPALRRLALARDEKANVFIWADEPDDPEVRVRQSDLAHALQRIAALEEALEPFKAAWDGLRDPLPQGPFTITVDAMHCARAAHVLTPEEGR